MGEQQTGQSTARYGRGVWTGPDGKRYSKAGDRRSDAAQYAREMQADAAFQRALGVRGL